MKNFFSNRNVTIINFLITAFFGSIYLIDKNKVDTVLIGVFREIFTLPFLAALLFFSVLGIVNFFTKGKKSALRIVSSLGLLTILFYIIRGFMTFWKF